jgi:hypothetical protein
MSYREIYYGTRTAVPPRNPAYNNQVLPTRVVQQHQQQQPERQPAANRNQPHFTGYDRLMHKTWVCRCASPNRHGDAYTPCKSSECYGGIPRRDLAGVRMSWEEHIHRQLDVLGKEHASHEEIRSTEAQVFHADTAQALEQLERNYQWALQRGIPIPWGIPHDAIWHRWVNPKHVIVIPPPETPGVVFLGPQGGYRPGPTASAQGTRLRGRATTLGMSWGASQMNNGDGSSSGGRPTSMGQAWPGGAGQTDGEGYYSQGRR